MPFAEQLPHCFCIDIIRKGGMPFTQVACGKSSAKRCWNIRSARMPYQPDTRAFTNLCLFWLKRLSVTNSLPRSIFTLEIAFDINLEYLGLSYDENSNQYDLGTSYVIDFQSFGTDDNYINQPGNCQNRLSTSFDGITNFDQYWSFRYVLLYILKLFLKAQN